MAWARDLFPGEQMKKVLPIALILVSGLVAFAQERRPCTIEFEQAPYLRGLKLGMLRADVEKLIKLESSESSQMIVIGLIGRPNFESVGQVGLRFVDQADSKKYGWPVNSLQAILILYGQDIKWRDVQEFVGTAAPGLGLPGAAFKVEGENASLKCNGFAVSMAVNQIEMIRTETANENINRERAENEKNEAAKKAFKP
jgi:hypothetical protein